MDGTPVIIDYLRPPDRLQRFEQTLVLQTSEWTVTYLPEAELKKPVMAGGKVILEARAPVVWFTYPGAWHDIGRFHRRNGEFTGIYANLLTPVVMANDRWETTDLCLDIWLGKDGTVALLDEEELATAESHGWIEGAIAAKAREHAQELLLRAASGTWPPPHVYEWTLERVRAHLGYASGSSK